MTIHDDKDQPLLGTRLRRQAHVLAELRRLSETLDRVYAVADSDDERHWLKSVSQLLDQVEPPAVGGDYAPDGPAAAQRRGPERKPRFIPCEISKRVGDLTGDRMAGRLSERAQLLSLLR